MRLSPFYLDDVFPEDPCIATHGVCVDEGDLLLLFRRGKRLRPQFMDVYVM